MLETARVTSASFETFIASAEPRLRRAFVARFGVEEGNDVTADVVAYAWEHWDSTAGSPNSHPQEQSSLCRRVGPSPIRQPVPHLPLADPQTPL